MHSSAPLRAMALLALGGCQADPAAPSTRSYELALGPGMSAELPHQCPETPVTLAVSVTSRGRPASGVLVYWEDWRVQSRLSARQSVSDEEGIARTIWLLPPLGGSQASGRSSVQAALPGALGNPLTYSIGIVRGTRC